MKRSQLLGALSAVLGSALISVVTSGPASAAPATPAFAAQAHAAGLTTSQAGSLQDQVNQYVRETGGKQVSVNQVNFDGGNVVLPLPGERYAHPYGTSPAAAATCAYGSFCMFHAKNFTGAKVSRSKCGVYTNIIWLYAGSWWNNQTPNVSATFYHLDDGQGGIESITHGAPYKMPSMDWSPIGSVRVC